MSPELHRAIAQTQLFTNGCDYVFLRFPLTQGNAVKRWLCTSGGSFFGAIWDKDEISLMMKQACWETAPPSLPAASVSPVYRCITFDVILEFDLVGYLAVITKVLAAHNIAVLAFSAFSRDHIFVQKSDISCAWDVLHALIQNSSIEEPRKSVGEK